MKIKILKKCTFKRGGTAVPGAIAVVLALALTFSACSENISGGAASSGNLNSGAVNTAEGIQLPPADADGIFTIAVIPDTQQEVVITETIADKYFLNRTEWLADNKEKMDLRFVIHTGDVVNWGNENPEQFEIASEAFEVLDEAEIPAALCLGNHDTAAVGVGGSAADPQNTRIRLRDTRTFNRYFSLDRYPDCIPFEENKIDNAYQLFEACGKKWLVLTLELWPRVEVVNWANEVVEKYSDRNVIIATHSYLTSLGGIYQNSAYGATSPQYLYDNLISRHENIKLVFSGHEGTSAFKVDYCPSGGKVASFLGCYHSNKSNPVQIIEIDVNEGTVCSRVFTPINGDELMEHEHNVIGMDFI